MDLPEGKRNSMGSSSVTTLVASVWLMAWMRDASEEDFKILHLVANLLLEQGRAETIDGDRRVIVFVHIHADKQSAKLRILGHT